MRPSQRTAGRRRRGRSATIAAALVLLGVGCGGHGDGDRVRAQQGPTFTVPAPLFLPVVDDQGSAWLLSEESPSQLRVTSADRRGLLDELVIETGLRPDIDPAISLGPEGVVVVFHRCTDETCTAAVAEVEGYVMRDEEVAPSNLSWESPPMSSGDAGAPRPVSATGGPTLVEIGPLVVQVDGGAVEAFELPVGAGDPCLVDGRLVAVASAGPPSGATAGGGDSESFEDQRPEITLIEAADSDWSSLPDSELSLSASDTAFRCGPGRLERAADGQLASATWDGRWNELQPGAVDWVFTAQSEGAGLLGVRDGSVALLDSVDGSVLMSRPLPSTLDEAWSWPQPTQDGPTPGPPSGAIAIGGDPEAPMAVACLTGQADGQEVRCETF